MIERIRAALERKGYRASECHGFYSFDLIAKKEDKLLFIKAISNIDNIPDEQAGDLASLMKDLGAHALVIGENTKSGRMQNGVVYERGSLHAVTIETFEEMSKKPPLVRAGRGGYYVDVDGAKIRERREELGYSLGHFARKVGVCRRTIVDCESGKTTTIENAIMIEKELDAPIAKQVDIFSKKEEGGPERSLPSFDGKVVQKLNSLGFHVAYAKKSPFNILADETSGKILSSLHKEDAERRATLMSKISGMIEASPVFILKSSPTKEVKGIPVLSEKQLKRASTPEELIERINF